MNQTRLNQKYAFRTRFAMVLFGKLNRKMQVNAVGPMKVFSTKPLWKLIIRCLKPKNNLL